MPKVKNRMPQIAAYLREYNLHAYDLQTALISDITDEAWDIVFPFLKEPDVVLNNESYKLKQVITALSQVPQEQLVSFVDFLRKKKIFKFEYIQALSNLSPDKHESFSNFIEGNHLYHGERTERVEDTLLGVLAKMPEHTWQDFVEFVRAKEFDIDVVMFGLLYAKYPKEDWEKIDPLVGPIYEFQLNILIEMSAEEFWPIVELAKIYGRHVLRLLSVSATHRVAILAFIKKNDLDARFVDSLTNIPLPKWRGITKFIEDYVLTIPNLNLSNMQTTYGCDAEFEFVLVVRGLVQIPEEELSEYERFLRANSITKSRWIADFAYASPDMRNHLLDYVKRFKPWKLDRHLTNFSSPQWLQFMASIDNHHITNLELVTTIARFDPEIWEELTACIEEQQITDYEIVCAFENTNTIRNALKFIRDHHIKHHAVIQWISWQKGSFNPEHAARLIRISAPLLGAPRSVIGGGAFLLHAINHLPQSEQEDRVRRTQRILATINLEDDRDYYNYVRTILESPEVQDIIQPDIDDRIAQSNPRQHIKTRYDEAVQTFIKELQGIFPQGEQAQNVVVLKQSLFKIDTSANGDLIGAVKKVMQSPEAISLANHHEWSEIRDKFLRTIAYIATLGLGALIAYRYNQRLFPKTAMEKRFGAFEENINKNSIELH